MKYVCRKDIYESDLFEGENRKVIPIFRGEIEEIVFVKEREYEILDPSIPNKYITLLGENDVYYEIIKDRFKRLFKS